MGDKKQNKPSFADRKLRFRHLIDKARETDKAERAKAKEDRKTGNIRDFSDYASYHRERMEKRREQRSRRLERRGTRFLAG